MLLILLFTMLVSSNPAEIQKMDQKIAYLKEEQAKLQRSIRLNTNNAMRWQNDKDHRTDARRAWDRVAKDQEILDEVEKKIKELEAEKKQLQ